MSIEEYKQEIKDNVKIEHVKPPSKGGQCSGMLYNKLRLYSKELDLTIETGYYRSTLKNKELLYTLFELTIDELIK